jgi:hypothetical protein
MMSVLVKRCNQKTTPQQQQKSLAEIGTRAFTQRTPPKDMELRKYGEHPTHAAKKQY